MKKILTVLFIAISVIGFGQTKNDSVAARITMVFRNTVDSTYYEMKIKGVKGFVGTYKPGKPKHVIGGIVFIAKEDLILTKQKKPRF